MSKESAVTGTTVGSKWNVHIPETKCITVYINGDEHFTGLRCVICLQKIKYYTALLNYLTEKLQPNFGAVRTLYDIQSGRKTSSLTDLIHNQKYAAAGVESFKKQDKWVQGSSNLVNNGRKKKISGSWNNNSSASLLNKRQKPTLEGVVWIYVYRNGENLTGPVKCFLKKSEFLLWSKLLLSLSMKLYPPTVYSEKYRHKVSNGFRLCSLNGQVMTVQDLKSGGTYVAVVNFETFKRRNYAPAQEFRTSPAHKLNEEDIVSRRNILLTEQHRKVAAVGSNSNVDSLEKSFFPHHFEDPENVFHARNENLLAKGAQEVQESGDMVTELPVELLDAQEVQEECGLIESTNNYIVKSGHDCNDDCTKRAKYSDVCSWSCSDRLFYM